jgi:hypothetical protein
VEEVEQEEVGEEEVLVTMGRHLHFLADKEVEEVPEVVGRSLFKWFRFLLEMFYNLHSELEALEVQED